MNICRFSMLPGVPPTARSGYQIRYGGVEGNIVREIEGDPLAGDGDFAFTDTWHDLRTVHLLPPCTPSKIVCVGRNYAEHAKEFQNEVPGEPLIFLKPPSSIITAGDHILYPRESERVDFEGEIGVVIGSRCRRLKPDDPVEPYIFGYTCVNDVTARDLQKKDGQWTRGKGFDTFCAFGPIIRTRDAVDPAKLRVRTTVNGQERQSAAIDQMIFPIPFIIRYISQFMTLEPGDLIATGTPAGVGPVQPGDVIEVAVEGIGSLKNQVQSEP